MLLWLTVPRLRLVTLLSGPLTLAPGTRPRLKPLVILAVTVPTLPLRSQLPPSRPEMFAEVRADKLELAALRLTRSGVKSPAVGPRVARPVVVMVPKRSAVIEPPLVHALTLRLDRTVARSMSTASKKRPVIVVVWAVVPPALIRVVVVKP